MDTAQSDQFDSYMGGTTNPGPHYTGQPSMRPADNSKGVPQVGETVRHRISGETGEVTGLHVHGHTGERMPVVRWDGQASKGFTSDQGYSLDSLTTP